MLKRQYVNIYHHQDTHWWYKGMRSINESLFRKYLPKNKPLKILDAGCGPGAALSYLSQFGDVIGVDISDEALKFAKKRGKVVKGDISDLPFKEETFDAVVAMDLLEHVPNPKNVIQEASRVLKNGGFFFFHTFNRTFLSYLMVIKGVEWVVKNTPKNMHVYSLFITPEEMAHMCHSSHLQVQEWKGVRPKLTAAFWKMLFTRKVPSTFEFAFTASLKTGYSAYAMKNSS